MKDNLILVIILIFYMAGCAKERKWQDGIKVANKYHDSRFNKYIIEFDNHFQYSSTSVIRFLQDEEYMEKSKQGICFLDTKLIIISPKHWDNLTEKGREILIAHELGHCEFKKGHDSRPEAIMHAYYNNSILINYNLDKQESLNEILEAPRFKE